MFHSQWRWPGPYRSSQPRLISCVYYSQILYYHVIIICDSLLLNMLHCVQVLSLSKLLTLLYVEFGFGQRPDVKSNTHAL
jgi:hypothetical protein